MSGNLKWSELINEINNVLHSTEQCVSQNSTFLHRYLNGLYESVPHPEFYKEEFYDIFQPLDKDIEYIYNHIILEITEELINKELINKLELDNKELINKIRELNIRLDYLEKNNMNTIYNYNEIKNKNKRLNNEFKRIFKLIKH